MWKLKLHYPFSGYGAIVLFFAFFIGWIALFVVCRTDYLPLIISMPAASMLLTFVLVYLIQNCNPTELRKKREAKAPEWRELTPREYDDLLYQKVKKSPALKYLLFGQIPLFIFAFCSEKDHEPWLRIILEFLAGSVAVSHFIVTALISAKWENVDGSARITEIDIDHSFRQVFSKDVFYYVYYTPHGRFVADKNQLNTDRTVKIVRWQGTYLYLE